MQLVIHADSLMNLHLGMLHNTLTESFYAQFKFTKLSNQHFGQLR